LALPGCANMSDTELTQAQGAGLGALLGAGIGAAVGGKQGAAIGAVTGAGLGYFAGYQIAQRKASYASTEQAIEEEIAWNQQFTQEVRLTNQELERSIQTHEREIAALRAQRLSYQQKQAALSGQKQSLQRQVADAQQKLNVVERELAESGQRYNQYGGNSSQWRNEIARLESEKQTLESNIATLNAMNNSI
jgi:chromosome segregation ATPase